MILSTVFLFLANQWILILHHRLNNFAFSSCLLKAKGCNSSSFSARSKRKVPSHPPLLCKLQVTEESSPEHRQHPYPTSAENLNKEIFKSLWLSDKEGRDQILCPQPWPNHYKHFKGAFSSYPSYIQQRSEIWTQYTSPDHNPESIDMFILFWLHTMQLYYTENRKYSQTKTFPSSNMKDFPLTYHNLVEEFDLFVVCLVCRSYLFMTWIYVYYFHFLKHWLRKHKQNFVSCEMTPFYLLIHISYSVKQILNRV